MHETVSASGRAPFVMTEEIYTRPVQSGCGLADTENMSEKAVGWMLFALLSGVLAGSILVFAAAATCRCEVPAIEAAL